MAPCASAFLSAATMDGDWPMLCDTGTPLLFTPFGSRYCGMTLMLNGTPWLDR